MFTSASEAKTVPQEGISAEELQGCLQEAGYAARIEQVDGRTTIRSAVVGSSFAIYLYGPNAGTGRATSVQFWAGWTLSTPPAAALEAVNEWNQTKRFGKAYLDRKAGAIVVEMDALVGKGVNRDHLQELASWWGVLMVEFMGFVRARS